MKEPLFDVLFLCTGNSARSIFAEYLLAREAPKVFRVASAGSDPKPAPNPVAIEVLKKHFGIDASGARSKSVEEFAGRKFDFVITLCDNARERCPVWPGQPVVAHWGSPDPALATGAPSEVERVFWQVSQQIMRRVSLFASLPFDKLDRLRLETETRAIGGVA